MNSLFDDRKAIEKIAQPSVHGVHRFPGIDNILRERIDAGPFRADGRRFSVRPQFFDVHQEIGQAALYCVKLVKTRIRRVDPLHQLDDTIFEMVGGDVAGARFLQLLDLLRQRLDERFQALWCCDLDLGAFRQRAGERVDAACEIIEFDLGARPDGEAIDLFGERLYLRR